MLTQPFSWRTLAHLLCATGVSVCLPVANASACPGIGGSFIVPERGYPADGDQGVPTNVAPLLYTTPPAAIGLFDTDQNAIPFAIERLGRSAFSPYLGEGAEDERNDEVFDIEVYQLVLEKELNANASYELVVRFDPWEFTLPETNRMTGYPVSADAGTATEEDGIYYIEREDEATFRSLFETSDEPDLAPPTAPDQAWLATYLNRQAGEGGECESPYQICVVGGTAGEGLLATLTFLEEGESQHITTVFAERDMLRMWDFNDDTELISAELTRVDYAGNRSDSVYLTRQDIPHNETSERVRCDSQPETDWSDLATPAQPLDGGTPAEEPSAVTPDTEQVGETGDSSAPEEDDVSNGDSAEAGASASEGDEPDAGTAGQNADGDDGADDSDSDDAGPSSGNVGLADDADGDCSCRTVGRGSPQPWHALLLLAVAVSVLRRRGQTQQPGACRRYES